MNDENIKKNVIDELYWDNRVDSSEIKAVVNDRKVKLEGTVPTYYDKTVVERDTWNVPGVTDVDNRLSVKYKSVLPPDKSIQGAIRDRIHWNPNLSVFKLDVKVEDNVATLNGTVDAYWKKIYAEAEAESVSGVVDIKNNIAVVPTSKISDEVIAKNVVNTIKRRSFVSIDHVDVKVENGEVTLTGEVPSRLACYVAVNAAENTAGVTAVHDKLNIM